MSVIDIEGIRITDKMIEEIRDMQEDGGTGWERHARSIDRAIMIIATELAQSTVGFTHEEGLSSVSDLFVLKRTLSVFSGKEIKNKQ